MTPAELARELQLQCPLVWLDTETTGQFPSMDRIVQVGAVKLQPDGQLETRCTLVNPTVRIPPEATEIHHITDEMVRDAPKFAQLARSLADFLRMTDFGGYNLDFDLKVLTAEFGRTDIQATLKGRVVDAFKVAVKYNPRDLSSMYRLYTGRELNGAHRADADAMASLECFMGQLEKHPDIPRSVEQLHYDYFEAPRDGCLDPDGKLVWRGGEAVMGFDKKWQGIPLRRVDTGYLRWMLKNDFSPAVKKIVQDALEGVFPKKEKTT